LELRWSLPGTGAGAGETEAKGRWKRTRDGAPYGWEGGRRRVRRRKEDGRRGGGGGGGGGERRARVWKALPAARERQSRRGLRRLWSLDDTSMD